MLLHAFPIGANLWEPQMRSIPAGWRLITPDLRGFGGSTELDSLSALSMADYADDIVDLLQELGVKRAVIGGCSMGGYAALALYQSTAGSVRRAWCWPTRAPARTRRRRAPIAATCSRWSIAKGRRASRAR